MSYPMDMRKPNSKRDRTEMVQGLAIGGVIVFSIMILTASLLLVFELAAKGAHSSHLEDLAACREMGGIPIINQDVNMVGCDIR